MSTNASAAIIGKNRQTTIARGATLFATGTNGGNYTVAPIASNRDIGAAQCVARCIKCIVT